MFVSRLHQFAHRNSLAGLRLLGDSSVAGERHPGPREDHRTRTLLGGTDQSGSSAASRAGERDTQEANEASGSR